MVYIHLKIASRAERGLEVSLISIVDVTRNQAFALSAEQTAPQPEMKKPETTRTRIDFYLEHLQRTAAYFPQSITHGVFDGFYAKLKFVDGVCALGYQVVSKLTCRRRPSVSLRRSAKAARETPPV